MYKSRRIIIKCPKGHKLIASSQGSNKRQKIFYCPYCKFNYPRKDWLLVMGGSEHMKNSFSQAYKNRPEK